MMFFLLMALIGVASSEFTFESSNYPTRFIRHRGYLLYLDPKETSDLYKKDSTFKVVTAINGDPSFISFESVNFPQHYIRHQSWRAKISKFDGSTLFREDASFRKQPALNGKVGFYSFESSNYPGRFLRHRGFEIWLDPQENAQLYKDDASFTFNPDFGSCRNGETGNVLPLPDTFPISGSTLMIAGGLCAVVVIINIVLLFNMCCNKRKRGYAQVKIF
eukprot:UN11812